MYDLTKQPKWVQDEIAGLERQLDVLRRQVEELRNQETLTYPDDLSWDRPIGIENHLGHPGSRSIDTLAQGTTVYFKQRRGYISIRQKGHDMNTIHIMSSNRTLQIRPEVSNVINIKQEED